MGHKNNNIYKEAIDKLVAMHKNYVTENETLLSRYAWMGARESGVKLGAGYKKYRF